MTPPLSSFTGIFADVESAGGIARFGIEPAYLAMQFGSFAVLASVLYFFGIKPILKTMDERNAKIEEGLKFSEEMKTRLAEAEKHYEARLNDAAAAAAKTAGEASERAKKFEETSAKNATDKADEILRHAAAQIENDRKKMLLELRGEIAKLVVETTEKVLKKELSPSEKSRFNDTAAAELRE